jgi:diguanylate cyclase (GGDEF)-like protein
MRAHADRGNLDPVAILRFLTSWLMSHILRVDQLMAEQIRHVDAGHTAAEAQAQAQAQADSAHAGSDASKPLIDALTNLYQIVSLRNRQLREANLTLETKVAERTADLARNEVRLRESEARLRTLSVTDSLTGIANRRKLEGFLQAEFQRAERFGSPVSVIIADIDHFKNVNDRFGHNVGDDVLCAFASLLTKSIRDVDLVARFGGEEFVIVMSQTVASAAAATAERLRISTAQIRVPTFPGALNASFGVASLQPGDTLHSLLKRADEALYAAKRNGRNRVETVAA